MAGHGVWRWTLCVCAPALSENRSSIVVMMRPPLVAPGRCVVRALSPGV